MVIQGCPQITLCGISSRFQLLSPTERQVLHALLTRSPLSNIPKEITPFDLHVLGTPPAFVLSQDQTLKKLYLKHRSALNHFLNNLLLAILLKNFRWLFLFVLYTILKQSILIVQGVLVRLCVIQFTRYCPSATSAANSVIIHQRFPFVKNFFRFFSFFFSLLLFATCALRACLYYQILPLLSSTFLLFRRLFFKV